MAKKNINLLPSEQNNFSKTLEIIQTSFKEFKIKFEKNIQTEEHKLSVNNFREACEQAQLTFEPVSGKEKVLYDIDCLINCAQNQTEFDLLTDLKKAIKQGTISDYHPLLSPKT